MEEKEEFSWTSLFFVTGFCFVAFSKVINFLDGSNMPVFTWIGVFAFVTGSLNGIRTLIVKSGR